MSTNTLEVDVAPEATGGEDVETPEITTEESLADLFARVETEDVTVEETIASDSEDEEPASEPEPEAETEIEDSSLETEEPEEEPVEEEAAEEVEAKTEVPDWVQPRIDKLTAQRKAAEEKAQSLEAKLAEQAVQESPVSSIDHVTSVSQLDSLEQQAINAEDQVDDLLETEPKYNDDGDSYWQVGDDQLNRKQLIDIRKNARQAFRAIPAKRKFLEQKAVTDANVAKIPFFNDPEDPWYAKTQEALESPAFKVLEREIPDAKAAVYLMIRGQQAIQAETQKKKKPAAKKPAPIIKSTPKSKAATDTGTSPKPLTDSDLARKQKDKVLSAGNVSSDDAALLFS